LISPTTCDHAPAGFSALTADAHLRLSSSPPHCTPEHYDFLLVESRRERPAVQAFLAALRDEATRARIQALGMRPADA
jgi:molybdate-binding protein